MTYLIIIVAVLVLLAVWGGVNHRRNPRIRMVEWGKRQKFIRLYPNPGFTIGSKHWCKAKGRRGH